MELKTYLTILVRRWQIVLLVAFAITGAFVYGSKKIPPSYQAETRLRVITPLAGSLRDTSHEVYFASRLVTTYAQIATSEQIMLDLKERLSVKSLPEINVEIVPDSEIIQIIVVSSDRVLAAEAANTLADLIISRQDKVLDSSPAAGDADILTDHQNELLEEISKETEEHDRLVRLHSQTVAQIEVLNRQSQFLETLYREFLTQQRQTEMQRVADELATLDQQYEKLSIDANIYSEQIVMIRQRIDNNQRVYSDLVYGIRPKRTRDIIVISPAVVPSSSSGPGTSFFAGLGLICGLIAGVVFAFIYDSLDARVFTFEQLGHVAATSLGQFPKLQTGRKQTDHFARFETAALYRDYWIVCTRILSILQDGATKTILVTSPNPLEGKSTFVFSVAKGLARNNKVLIVDADLRRPRQQKIYPISAEQGLDDLLESENVKFKDVVQKDVMPGVDLLPVRSEYNGAGTFNSPRFSVVLQEARKYDVVLFDAPALLTTTADLYSLTKIVDGVIVLVQWGRTTISDIQSACKYLEGLGAKMLGVILNQVPVKKEQNHYSRRESKSWLRFMS